MKKIRTQKTTITVKDMNTALEYFPREENQPHRRATGLPEIILFHTLAA